jgi:UDP-N-acetylglucosamine:LPS N-acetylglucosamine transferase
LISGQISKSYNFPSKKFFLNIPYVLVSFIYVTDTRQLTGAARLLYAGARKTREGVEIILRDQDAALANIARSVGVFEEAEQKPANTQAIAQSLKGVTDPNEASRIYQSIMRS